jgi:hypothetical protein
LFLVGVHAIGPLITGQPPRLPPMTAEEMGPEAMTLVRDMRRAVGLDPDAMTEVPDYMSTILRRTELYRTFGDYGLQLMKGLISPRAWRSPCFAPGGSAARPSNGPSMSPSANGSA